MITRLTIVVCRLWFIFYTNVLYFLDFIWNFETDFRGLLFYYIFTFCLWLLKIIYILFNMIFSFWKINFMRFQKMSSQSILSNQFIALIALNFLTYLLFFFFYNFFFFLRLWNKLQAVSIWTFLFFTFLQLNLGKTLKLIGFTDLIWIFRLILFFWSPRIILSYALILFITRYRQFFFFNLNFLFCLKIFIIVRKYCLVLKWTFLTFRILINVFLIWIQYWIFQLLSLIVLRFTFTFNKFNFEYFFSFNVLIYFLL